MYFQGSMIERSDKEIPYSFTTFIRAFIRDTLALVFNQTTQQLNYLIISCEHLLSLTNSRDAAEVEEPSLFSDAFIFNLERVKR